MIRPEQERARLAGVYSAMSDEELRKVATSGDELTLIAQEALQAEVARRGLDLTSPTADDSPEPDEPEVLLPPSGEERKRLTGVYSAMSDEELEELAAIGFDLSDEARQALEAEIGRRGLQITLAPPPGVDVYEWNDLVTLRQFRDLPDALLAKGSLQSAGIESQLVDDNMIRMDWFISNLLGGIKLKVRGEDLEAANEILNQPIPATIEIEGGGTYAQPKCPQCQSLDVSFRELDKLFSYGSAYVGFPFPADQKAWMCRACGNRWEGDPDAARPPEPRDAV